MKRWYGAGGFTIVEILIVIVVIAILASISVVGYRGIQLRATQAVVQNDLHALSEQLMIMAVTDAAAFSNLTGLPGSFVRSNDVVATYNPLSGASSYSNLTPVQNGVLFYTICEELIADPFYSVIHARDGNSSQSVVMRCTDNIQAGGMLITGWDSRYWSVPVTVATIQSYMNSVPSDSWWTDRQDVVRGFYQELINRFQQKGGTFPVTTFWDPWANQWSGVYKEELPTLPAIRNSYDGDFCIEAYHSKYPDNIYKINQNGKIEEGGC